MQIPNWRPRSQLRGNSKGLKMIILIMITDLEDTEALGTTEFLGKGFLLVYNSNYGPPMHSTARIHECDQPTANQPMTSRCGLSRYAPLTTVRCIKITICNTYVLNETYDYHYFCSWLVQRCLCLTLQFLRESRLPLHRKLRELPSETSLVYSLLGPPKIWQQVCVSRSLYKFN